MKQTIIATNLISHTKQRLLDAIEDYGNTESIKQQLKEKGIHGRKLINKSKLDLVELLEHA